MVGVAGFEPRCRKLCIIRFRAYQIPVCAKTHSLRCSSFPPKALLFGDPVFLRPWVPDIIEIIKAEEANDKRIKDTSNYYYTKPITDKNKDLKTTPTTRETTIKEIFSNHDKGETIKKKFFEETKLKENEYKIRLFFSGMEIKDNDFIYQHKLEDNFKIQIMKIKI